VNEDAEVTEAASSEAAAELFRCPNCNAELEFDAASQAMACEHCGHRLDIPTEDGDDAIVEYDLQHGIAASSKRGLGAEVRAAKCSECGATVSFGDNATATACAFCGSSQVLAQQANRNLLRPESVVPFQIDGGSAQGEFRGWLGKLWFRPSDLRRQARSVQISGVYVPYWTFDCGVDSSWRAQSGYYYWVSESYTTRDSQGNTVRRTRRVRKTRWRPSSGARNDRYDDVLVCASLGLPRELAERLETFDTRRLQPYKPEYLAGWKAEEYAVELNDAWTRAVARIEGSQRTRCARDVPGDTHRFLRVTNRFRDETFKHVLLPIWISSYRYKDKVYRFLVNGQTGEVTGVAPWSWLKITLLIVVILAAIAGVVLAVQR
jgi:DNA-directed RNA polymerase subunit RPC12/RpoP